MQFDPHASTNWLTRPLFMQAKLPDADITTLSAESDSSSVPLNLIAPRATLELLQALGDRYPDGARLRALADSDFRRAARVRAHSGPARRRERWDIGRVG